MPERSIAWCWVLPWHDTANETVLGIWCVRGNTSQTKTYRGSERPPNGRHNGPGWLCEALSTRRAPVQTPVPGLALGSRGRCGALAAGHPGSGAGGPRTASGGLGAALYRFRAALDSPGQPRTGAHIRFSRQSTEGDGWHPRDASPPRI